MRFVYKITIRTISFAYGNISKIGFRNDLKGYILTVSISAGIVFGNLRDEGKILV